MTDKKLIMQKDFTAQSILDGFLDILNAAYSSAI
jgi:hypothetical protein